ncbi:hypothetical protein, partial [Photobacterium sp. R1]
GHCRGCAGDALYGAIPAGILLTQIQRETDLIEILQQLTAMGLPPTMIALLIVLYKQDKRLTILETNVQLGKKHG